MEVVGLVTATTKAVDEMSSVAVVVSVSEVVQSGVVAVVVMVEEGPGPEEGHIVVCTVVSISNVDVSVV